MNLKTVLASLVAMALSIASFASPVTTTLDSTFWSSYQDKGVMSARATLITSAVASYESFNVGVTTYAPTILSVNGSSTGLSRADFMGSYTFTSSLADVSIGSSLKHYNKPGKTGAGDRSQPFVKLAAKGVPLTFVARYDIPTRNLNVEANAKLFTMPVGAFKVTPSAYLGYSDISDQFPHSLKAVKQNNVYYGGGIGASYPLLGGALSAGGYINQSDNSFANRTLFYTIGYNVKL